jgi:hypothetical protein
MLTTLSNIFWVWLISGAAHKMQLKCKIWTTWLLYVILINLTDAVAEALNKPFSAISIEMVYRSLYFFVNISTPHCTLAPYASAGVALRSNADERRELCS